MGQFIIEKNIENFTGAYTFVVQNNESSKEDTRYTNFTFIYLIVLFFLSVCNNSFKKLHHSTLVFNMVNCISERYAFKLQLLLLSHKYFFEALSRTDQTNTSDLYFQILLPSSHSSLHQDYPLSHCLALCQPKTSTFFSDSLVFVFSNAELKKIRETKIL